MVDNTTLDNYEFDQSVDSMLTTIDNPFDPFDQFDSWLMFDIEKGYNTSGKLMRIAKVSDDMSQVEYDKAVDLAMETLIKYDFLDIYKKVTRKKDDTE